MSPEDAADPTPPAPTPPAPAPAPAANTPADGAPPATNAPATNAPDNTPGADVASVQAPEGHGALPPQPANDELLSFTCPRCRLAVTEELYGPCGSCRTTLRAVIGGEAREIEQQDYVPKMNVTPNAVASKD